jgi:hypothetical protein
MDRETRNPDSRRIRDSDIRGIGRQMAAQQRREAGFDKNPEP